MFKVNCARSASGAVFFVVFGLSLAACGGGSSTASQSEIAQAEKHARQVKTEKEKERRLERKLERLERENKEAKQRRQEKARQQKKAREEAHVAPPAESSPNPTSTPSGTDCGGGVFAGPETSCAFALETRAEYEREIGAGSGSIEAYSEANEEWYPMYCTEGSEHECSGAISATVYWP
jgi:chromosome segregation ATPase